MLNSFKKYLNLCLPASVLAARNRFKKRKALQPYKGDKVECPVCGERFSHFATFGKPPRKNAQCPACYALERHRLLTYFLK